MLTALRAAAWVAVLLLVGAAIFVGLQLSGHARWLAFSQDEVTPVRPDIPFAPMVDESLKDPDNPAKVFRVDMARVEQEFPLDRADLAGLTPANLLALSQEEIDQLYGRLTAGPIPDGVYLGDLFFPRGESLGVRLGEILGGFEGRLAAEKVELAEAVGRSLWKGKMFDRDERVLRNLIDDFAPLSGLIDDPDALATASVPREGWLKHIRPETSVWLLFPAKLYCGQSLMDGRRESIIIDYAYNDDLPGYQANPDALVGRNGLRIRDEIRMIRPGFYLGRAYANKLFLLNFMLVNETVAEAGIEGFARGDEVAEECWAGEQLRQVGAE
jgi:hypothetical protein